MASTYSTNLALELIGTGDQAGTWGTTTNTNLGTLLEQAVSGYVTQAVATGTDTPITIPNGATGVARNMYIELTGTGGASTNLIVPANKKLYFIYNNTSSGQVTVKVSGQTGVSVPNGAKMVLVSNGTDIVKAVLYTSGTSLLYGDGSGGFSNVTIGSGISFAGGTLSATGSGGTITGSGTTNYVSKFSSSTALGNSVIYDDGTNVGIGTASPSTKLEVAGSITSTGGSVTADSFIPTSSTPPTNGMYLAGTSLGFSVGSAVRATLGNTGNFATAGSGYIDAYAYTLRSYTSAPPTYGITSPGGTSLALSTNGAYRITIDSSGSVGIGTTSPTSTSKLTVNGIIDATRLGLGGTTNPGGYYLQLGTDGAAKPVSNVWIIASDSRVKDVTGEYTKGLEAVCNLRPITYKYNGKAGFIVDGQECISIIAQEAIKHFPECVGTYKTKLNPEDAQDTELYNWNGHALTFALVNAIKELKAQVDELKAEIAVLKGA